MIFNQYDRGYETMDDPEGILAIANRWLSEGRGICLATVIRRKGSAPREVGAKMVMAADGEISGSIGGGGAEKEIMEHMTKALETGEPAVIELDLSGRTDDLDAMCGGEISVFIEPMGRARTLVVIGAGHIGVALAGLARRSGFAVTLVDDRKEYLAGPGPAEGVKKVCAVPEDYEALCVDGSSFVVICTRGHSLDKDWLQRLVTLRPRYLGMLGSRNKARSIFNALEEEGVAREALDRVRTPVGLDIGALTPMEIAVSITAELISVWRKPAAAGEA
jgi:xanthine dehydrogenase accessory factor